MTPTEALDLIKKQLMMTSQNKELFKIIEEALPHEPLPFNVNDWLGNGEKEADNMCARYELAEEDGD